MSKKFPVVKGERFSAIKGYPMYAACSNGHVYSISSGKWKILAGGCSGRYQVVVLCNSGHRITRDVHRVIAESFLGRPTGSMQCRHLDGNPRNNRIENLAWGTAVDNAADKKRHGTEYRPIGSLHHMSKLTESDVIQIRRMLDSEADMNEIAATFHVTYATIRYIKVGKTWRHVSS